jgi:hypothetical protein
MRSESISEIAKALAAAQAEMRPAEKNAMNPAFKSRYANFEAIVEASKCIHKHGLAVTQTTSVAEGRLQLHTFLTHTSGQYLESVYPLRPVQDTPQAMGSAITYAKRYTYSAILGMATGEGDDDGEVAMEKPVPVFAVKKREPQPAYQGTDTQRRELWAKVGACNLSKEQAEAVGKQAHDILRRGIKTEIHEAIGAAREALEI